MYYRTDADFPESLYVDFEGKKFKNFDTPDALDTDLLIQHIEQLKNGQEVQIPEYDFGNNPTGKSQRKPGRIIKPKDFIILDGLFGLCHPRLRELTDVSIFIELSAVNRMARRMIRDW
jgi:uridine kinase